MRKRNTHTHTQDSTHAYTHMHALQTPACDKCDNKDKTCRALEALIRVLVMAHDKSELRNLGMRPSALPTDLKQRVRNQLPAAASKREPGQWCDVGRA